MQSVSNTYAAKNKSNTTENTLESAAEQPKILEHKVTAPELKELKQEVGLSDEGEESNQIDGHGTGLRPPMENEWANIADRMYVVDSISFDPANQIPSTVDCSKMPWFPPIGNQGAQGSCVCFAVGYYMKTFQEAREHQWNLSGTQWQNGYNGYPTPSYQSMITSPSFLYNLINGGVDKGTSAPSALDVICSIGACSWKEMPYDAKDYTSWPSEEAWREAALYRGNYSGYEELRLTTDVGLASLKNWIASDNLAVIAIGSAQYENLSSNDVWTISNDVNAPINHENTIVGYDDNVQYTEEGQLRQGAFKIANSWGVGWFGDHNSDGFYWISYKAMQQRVRYCNFCRDIIGYEPQLVASFRINYSDRGNCTVIFGIGNHSDPIAKKPFGGPGSLVRGGNHPFCPNNIVLDITEFKDVVPTVYTKSFFISVSGGSNVTGTLTAFSVHNVVSGDPPLTIVNNGTVFADVFLPHTINVRSDYSTIQEAVNSVVLGTSEDPGVIISVPPGTYNENVLVNKTVSIVAQSPKNTFISGSHFNPVFDVLANNVHITDLTIVDGAYGILIVSSNNTISENDVTNNGCGICFSGLGGSGKNTVYHNSFINNTNQVILTSGSAGVWDNGYPSGGNYWSDYATRYPNTAEIDNSGLWNTPYVIDPNNKDNYPLMSPWSSSATYGVTIKAHCNTEGIDLALPIAEDGSGTGYITPHTFSLSGSHTFKVQGVDVNSHPFLQWSTNQTSTTITLSSNGTYTAYYQAPTPQTYSATINAHCNTEGLDVGVGITKDGSATGYDTPHAFSGLSSSHTFTVPSADTNGHPFLQWSTGQTSTTITVTSGGTYTAHYQAVQHSLTVSSAHDSPSPSVGIHTYNDGSSVTCSVTSTVVEGGVSYTCTGWSGTGSVPSSGSVTSVTFTITQDSTMTWNWAVTQRNLTVSSAHDSPSSGIGVHTYGDGSSVTCSVTSPVTEGGTVWTCTGWSGTGSVPATGSGTSLTFTITQDSTITWNWQVGVLVHDVAVTNVTSSKSFVGQGYDLNITITVLNQGDFTETFNVTAYANTTAPASQNVTLSSGNSTNITLTWNTTGFAHGNYTIRAYASPVPNETDTANNNFTMTMVTITILGDINGDFKVTLADLVLLSNAYSFGPGDANWNADADLDNNGVVGLTDLVMMTIHYGQHYP
jgi:parallel beta-helix repeat protein